MGGILELCFGMSEAEVVGGVEAMGEGYGVGEENFGGLGDCKGNVDKVADS